MQAPVSFRSLGPLLVVLLGAAACTQGIEEPSVEQGPDSMEPPPGTIVIQPSTDDAQVPKAAVATTTYQWDEEPANGVSLQTHLCVASSFYGKFESDNDEFELQQNTDTWGIWTNNWMFQGPNETGRGAMTCVKHSAFVPDAGGVHWISGWFPVSGDPDFIPHTDRDMWWGTAASFVSGISGEFAGGGEYVQVTQSTDGYKPSVLSAESQSSEIDGVGFSYFVGVPKSGKLVKLYGYKNGSWVRGNVLSSGTFEYPVSTQAGFSSYWLPPRDKAFCYLTRVSGNFDGGGEQVRITVNGGQWFLNVQSGGGKYVSGKVRCMAYDQRG
jgi:hypothetical protein